MSGFGTEGTESAFPQNRSLAVAAGYYLTYSDGNLSAWDSGGNRVGFTQLVGAGTGFESYLALSFADGKVWVIDNAASMWVGYDVPPLVSEEVPTSSPWSVALLAALLVLAVGATVALTRRQRALV